MADPRPVTLTSGSNPNPAFEPEPLVVVGNVPGVPSKGTAAELTAGTSTTGKTWSAKDIADYVAAQIAANA